MSMRTIFVPVFPNRDVAGPCDAALSVARRVGAHIDAVFVRADPAASLVAVPELAFAVTVEQLEREGTAAETKAKSAFEAWRERAGVAAEAPREARDAVFARWSGYQGPLETLIVRRGRLSDLTVLGHEGAADNLWRFAFDVAVFSTGRPTLLVPQASSGDLLSHVVISWNGSQEAVHAVMGGLALLRRAQKVSIFSADSLRTDAKEAENLKASLYWHGIDASCLAPRPDEPSIGAALLRAAGEAGASLIVMGGYTHGRVHQMLLGGVTKHVVEHMALPVLIAH